MESQPSPAPLPDVLEAQLARFVGREWAIAEVADRQRAHQAWLTIIGPPGIGKSAIAARLVQMSRRREFPVLHAANFCRRQDSASIDPRDVITHLAWQLMNSVPGYAQAVVDGQADWGIRLTLNQQIGTVAAGGSAALITELTITERNPRTAWRHMLRKPLEQLARAGRLDGPVRILIDGLDEAVEGFTGYHLARLLDEERDPLPGVNLIVTTRPGEAADRVDAAGRGPVIDLVEGRPPDSDDVLAYARAALVPHFGSEAPGMAAAIATASLGNFLYAVNVVEELVNQRREARNVREGALPIGLRAYYRDFLRRQIAAETDAWRRAYRPVLGVIAESRAEGLTFRQLRAILGGRDHLTRDLTLRDVLADCAPYLFSGGRTGPFQLYHQSLRDYLRTSEEHRILQVEANRDIVTGLLSLIDQDGTRNWRASDRYTRRHLLTHAVRAGTHEELLSDQDFLVYAESPALINFLRSADGPGASEAASLLDLTDRTAVVPADSASRRDVMAVRAGLLGRTQTRHRLTEGADRDSLLPYLRWASTAPGAKGPMPGAAHVTVAGARFLAAAFHIDDDYMPQICFWELATGQLRDDLTTEVASERDTVLAGGPDPDSSLIALGGGGYESHTLLYDAATGTSDLAFYHSSYTSDVVIAGRGDDIHVVGVGDDYGEFHGNPGTAGTLLSFHPSTGKRDGAYVGRLPIELTSARVDGRTMAVTWNPPGDLRRWDLDDLQQSTLIARTGGVRSLDLVPHGTTPLLLVTGDDNVIYNVADGAVAHRLPPADPGYTGRLAALADGRLLVVSGNHNGRVAITDVSHPDRSHRLQLPGPISGLAISHDHQLAVVFDTGVALVDLAAWADSPASR